MTRVLHRPHATEALIPCATAQQAVPVERPRAVSPQRPSRPVGVSRAVLAELRAADRTLGMTRPTAPVPPSPIVLTDWQARIAADWKQVDHRIDNLGEAYVREVNRNADVDQYEVYTATAPLLSELTELKAVQLVNWRQALRVHAEAELALYGTKAGASA